jgi:hypothetical protein
MSKTSKLNDLTRESSYNATTAFQFFQEIESQLKLLNDQLEQLYQKKNELRIEISELKNALETTINRVSKELAYLNKIQKLENDQSGKMAFKILLEMHEPPED